MPSSHLAPAIKCMCTFTHLQHKARSTFSMRGSMSVLTLSGQGDYRKPLPVFQSSTMLSGQARGTTPLSPECNHRRRRAQRAETARTGGICPSLPDSLCPGLLCLPHPSSGPSAPPSCTPPGRRASRMAHPLAPAAGRALPQACSHISRCLLVFWLRGVGGSPTSSLHTDPLRINTQSRVLT